MKLSAAAYRSARRPPGRGIKCRAKAKPRFLDRVLLFEAPTVRSGLHGALSIGRGAPCPPGRKNRFEVRLFSNESARNKKAIRGVFGSFFFRGVRIL